MKTTGLFPRDECFRTSQLLLVGSSRMSTVQRLRAGVYRDQNVKLWSRGSWVHYPVI